MADSVSLGKWTLFSRSEFESRIAAVQALLAAFEIDAMILASPTHWLYYGGVCDAPDIPNGMWRGALIVSQEHPPAAIFEVNYFWALAHTSWLEDVHLYSQAGSQHARNLREAETFGELLCDRLRVMKLDRARLGFELGADALTPLSFLELEDLRAALPQARFVAADEVLFAQQAVKTEFEQATLRNAARLACECIDAALAEARPGASELDLHKRFWLEAARRDMIRSPYRGTWMCFTADRTDTIGGHRWTTGPVERTLASGDWGHCDGGPSYRHYHTDLARPFSIGEPTPRTLELYAMACEVFDETVEGIESGLPFSTLFAEAERARERRGLSGNSNAFLGSSIGLAPHEAPWITRESDVEVQPGMVLTLEVAAFDESAAHFGGMAKDMLLVRESGVENLTASLSREFRVCE